MPKLTKLFWRLTITSTLLIWSSVFAQEEGVEPQEIVDSSHDTSDTQDIPSQKYVELLIKGPLAEVKPTFIFSSQV